MLCLPELQRAVFNLAEATPPNQALHSLSSGLHFVAITSDHSSHRTGGLLYVASWSLRLKVALG